MGRGHVTARAIVDAAASTQDPAAALLLHGKRLAIVFDRKSVMQSHNTEQPLIAKGVALSRLEVNLGQVVRA